MRWATMALLAASAALAGAAAVLWLTQRPWFDFRRIEIRGDVRHVSGAAVRAASCYGVRQVWFSGDRVRLLLDHGYVFGVDHGSIHGLNHPSPVVCGHRS